MAPVPQLSVGRAGGIEGYVALLVRCLRGPLRGMRDQRTLTLPEPPVPSSQAVERHILADVTHMHHVQAAFQVAMCVLVSH
jgi:hypothetical protein